MLSDANQGTRASYDAIKRLLLNVNITGLTLETLKNHFYNDIGSRRLRECIRNVADLVEILERRDIINEHNVKALHVVSDIIRDETLKEYTNNYVPPENVENLPYENVYREIRLADSLREHFHLRDRPNLNVGAHGEAVDTSHVTAAATSLSPFTREKRFSVYKKLAKELGKHWRSFGRELDIAEGDMDNIELQFPRDLSSRVYKLMEVFEDDECHDPKRHVFIICQALENIKRNDIRRKIYNIMSY